MAGITGGTGVSFGANMGIATGAMQDLEDRDFQKQYRANLLQNAGIDTQQRQMQLEQAQRQQAMVNEIQQAAQSGKNFRDLGQIAMRHGDPNAAMSLEKLHQTMSHDAVQNAIMKLSMGDPDGATEEFNSYPALTRKITKLSADDEPVLGPDGKQVMDQSGNPMMQKVVYAHEQDDQGNYVKKPWGPLHQLQVLAGIAKPNKYDVNPVSGEVYLKESYGGPESYPTPGSTAALRAKNLEKITMGGREFMLDRMNYQVLDPENGMRPFVPAGLMPSEEKQFEQRRESDQKALESKSALEGVGPAEKKQMLRDLSVQKNYAQMIFAANKERREGMTVELAWMKAAEMMGQEKDAGKPQDKFDEASGAHYWEDKFGDRFYLQRYKSQAPPAYESGKPPTGAPEKGRWHTGPDGKRHWVVWRDKNDPTKIVEPNSPNGEPVSWTAEQEKGGAGKPGAGKAATEKPAATPPAAPKKSDEELMREHDVLSSPTAIGGPAGMAERNRRRAEVEAELVKRGISPEQSRSRMSQQRTESARKAQVKDAISHIGSEAARRDYFRSNPEDAKLFTEDELNEIYRSGRRRVGYADGGAVGIASRGMRKGGGISRAY